MMFRLISILLLALGTFHFGKNVVLVANYAIDYDYISEVFCINKDKPKSKCNGKCHLAKQLKKAEPIQSEQSKSALVNQVEFLFYFLNAEGTANDFDGALKQIRFIDVDQNTLEFYAEVPVPPPSFS